MKNIFCSLLFGLGLALNADVLAHENHKHPDVHLSFPQAGVHAHIFWLSGPQVMAESQMRIDFRSAKDHSVISLNATPQVEIDMPSMGHGSAPTRIEAFIDSDGNIVEGSYIVSSLFFIMGGEWEVQLHLYGADGSVESQVFFIEIEEQSSHSDHQHHH